MKHRRSPNAFTLVELLVAMSIAAFMMLVFNQIFTEATGAVSRGLQTSDILTKVRAADEQFSRDTATEVDNVRSYSAGDPATTPPSYTSRMVGPWGDRTPGDATPEFGGVLVIVNHRFDIMQMADGPEARVVERQNVRADQLIFFVDNDELGDRLPALAPATTSTYGGDPRNSLNAGHARMWYGHLQVEDQAPGNALGRGTFATRWMLGRHALLMPADNDLNGESDVIASGGPAAGVYGDIYVDEDWGWQPASAVAGYGGSPELGDAVADVTRAPLSNLVMNTMLAPGGAGPLSPAYAASNGWTSPNTYASEAVTQLAFRLSPMNTELKQTGDLRAVDIAPMHPLFVGNVSDFIIEWAADYDNNDDPADAYPLPDSTDGEMDRLADGRIRWYSFYPNDPAADDPDQPEVYLAPLVRGGVANPEYVNVGAGNATAAYVWGQAAIWPWSSGVTEPATGNWPYLIRIRYRVHDSRGAFVGRRIDTTGDGEPDSEELGQWFETVIPVNRQPQ